MPTAEDSTWPELIDLGSDVPPCLTFVKDRPAGEVVRRLNGAEVARMNGLDRFERYWNAVTVPAEAFLDDGSVDATAHTGREFVAVGDVPGGAVLVEQGTIGITDDVLRQLSTGTSVAVVFSSMTEESRFAWAQDGDLRVAFDPFNAGWREGSTPDALIPAMEQFGFSFSDEDLDDLAMERAFALAHHVTGIRLTNDALTQSTYLAVSVPAPWSESPDTDAVPPLYFHDVAPTVDQRETMNLGGDLIVAAIGQPITVEPAAAFGIDAAVQYTVRSVHQAPDNQPDPEAGDQVWLLADVEAIGIRGPINAQPHDFTFVAADHSRYWPIGISDQPAQLVTTLLQPGERASGLVLFHVPADVPPLGRIIVKTVGVDGDIPLGCWPMDGPPARYDGPDKYPW